MLLSAEIPRAAFVNLQVNQYTMDLYTTRDFFHHMNHMYDCRTAHVAKIFHNTI